MGIKSFFRMLNSKVAKIFAIVGATTLASTSAFANVTFDPNTGFSGSIDLTYVYAAFGLVLGAQISIWGLKRIFAFFKG